MKQDNALPWKPSRRRMNSVSTIASAGGITGFAANKFALELGDFVNPYTGSFSIAVSGNNINIVYTGAAAIPIGRAIAKARFHLGAIGVEQRNTQWNS